MTTIYRKKEDHTGRQKAKNYLQIFFGGNHGKPTRMDETYPGYPGKGHEKIERTRSALIFYNCSIIFFAVASSGFSSSAFS
jgi:hypothetical protein